MCTCQCGDNVKVSLLVWRTRYTDTFCNAVDCPFELALEVQRWTRARSECLPGVPKIIVTPLGPTSRCKHSTCLASKSPILSYRTLNNQNAERPKCISSAASVSKLQLRISYCQSHIVFNSCNIAVKETVNCSRCIRIESTDGNFGTCEKVAIRQLSAFIGSACRSELHSRWRR